MAYRRAERPLDPNAVATANQQLWSQFPELKGRQLTPDDDIKYRSYWMDQYEKAGGAVQKPKPLPPKTPTQPCLKTDDDAPTVKITEPPCRFIAKGKKRKIKAVGQPPGGSYSWTTTGAVSVASGGSTDEVEIIGGGPSGAIDDSELRVQYTLHGKTAKDSIKLTAYEISKVEAKLRGTPCKRTGSRADTMPAKSSTSDSKVFGPTTPTIVKGCGDLHLTATVAPPTVPVSWVVERADDDDGSLTGTPTDADDGGATKRKVTADATGSFHVIVFHDCTKAGKPDAADARIVFNLNIIDLEITQNSVVKRDTWFRDDRSTAGTLVIDSSKPGTVAPGTNTAYTDAESEKRPLSAKVTVKLVGGGANERRGTDKVRLGYIQTTTADSITGTYADGKTLKEAIFEDPALADPVTGGAPATLAFPVRDTRGAGNSGAGPFIVNSSDVDKSELPSGGLQRVVRYLDSPAIVLSKSHPVTGSALASIAGSNNFDIFLCAYSTDFDENYTVAGSVAWSITYGSYTAADGWKKTGAAVTAPGSMTVHSPPKRAEDLNVERCPPNFVDNLKMDAR